jgi:hypothetical protein
MKGWPLALQVIDDGFDRRRCVAAFREVAGYVEHRVTLGARSEDVGDDVCDGDAGEVRDLPIEESRFPLAPLPGQIVVTHPGIG